MSAPDFSRPRWYGSTLAVALFGSILLWAALPPLAWGWLGWIAPVPWLLLVRAEQLPGRAPYRSLWLAGLVFWLLAIHWLRLPHPATSLGWIALSAYLAFYLPAFVGLSRVAVHQLGVPLWLAAPVVWTGLELARAHLLTGFLMASLAHTQVHWIALIQISDLVGEYGVDFVMMLVAACLTSGLPFVVNGLRMNSMEQKNEVQHSGYRCIAIFFLAVASLSTALAYGHWRLGNLRHGQLAAEPHPIGPRIALIQGNSLAEWKFDPNRERQIMDEYVQLSERAIAEARRVGDGRPPDIVVWPETMFRTPLITFDHGYKPPEGATRSVEEVTAWGPKDLAGLVNRLGAPVLVGIDRAHYPAGIAANGNPLPPERFNSAVLVGRDGKIIGTYDKMHLVMFGEYIPFARWLPILYRWTPLTGGIEAGTAPAALMLGAKFCFVPNICYETAIPHVIRRQVRTLEDRGSVPDTLVNLTNDAWYWGSSELDMHLACGVFRAVETRLPLVVAANGGISAWIDEYGSIRAQSPSQQADVLIADIEPRSLQSPYVRYGDWFAAFCLTVCVALAAFGWKTNRTTTKTRRHGD